MAYRAEIEIGVKGQQRIQRLSSEINKSAKAVDSLADSLGSRGVVSQSLNNFDKLLNRTKRTLDSVIAGTDAEKKAVKEYVTVLGQANSFQERQNRLIAEEIRQRDGATAALKRYNAAAMPGRQPGGSMAGRYLRPGQARGTTQFGGPIGPGPASATALSSPLPASSRFFGGTQYSGPIGPGPASSIFGGQSSAVEGRIKRILAIKKDELQLERALIGLQQKSKGLDAESIKENNRLLNLKADEVARNKEIIRQERVKQSILRKRQRLEAAGRTPGGGRRGRAGKRFTDIATGAGFPLLFGGGPLQALAGGVGGAFLGLGGAIGASAIVAQVEAFATAAAQAGQALTTTAGTLDFVREKSLFTSEQAKDLAAQLEEQGDVAGLASLLTQELVERIGNSGVAALNELGDTTNETTKLWNELTLQLQILISGPLNGFLKLINNAIGGINQALKPTAKEDFTAIRDRILAGDDENAKARVRAIEASVTSTRRLNAQQQRKGMSASFLTEEGAAAGLKQLGAAGLLPKVPVTLQDERDFAVKGKEAGNEAERVKQRIDALRREREEIIAISGIKDKIALAEAANDSQLVIRLQGQQRLRQIETERLNDLAKAKTAEEARAINQTAVVKALAAQLDTTRQLAEEERQRQEKAQEVLSGLLDEQALLQATLDGRKEEEQIKQRLAEIMKQNPTLARAEVQAILEGNQALREKITLQQKQDQLYAQIGQTIQSGIVNGIQSAIDGSKSLGESLSGILRQIGGLFLQAGIGSFGVGGKPGSGLLGLLPFAEGGYVSGPTPALIGEGGQGEYVIPEAKMRESMARYSRGARGSAVIPETGGSGTSSGGGGTAVAAPIDVRFNVERINNVDYVTAEQFQAGMRQAANQGAKQGEQQTLKRLQMSGSTRKRLGM